jgi:hypothetical protein
MMTLNGRSVGSGVSYWPPSEVVATALRRDAFWWSPAYSPV